MSINSNTPAAFVTYGWCRTSCSIVRSLGERGIEVHVGDTSKLAMSRYSRYCKSFTQLPDFFEHPETYFDAVLEAMKKSGAIVLMPAHEDVQIFSQRVGDLPDWVQLAVPDYKMWNIGEDKLDYVEAAQESGCPVPVTHKVSSVVELEEIAEQVDFPVLIKTRIGNSAKGVFIAKDRDLLIKEFKAIVEEFNLSEDRLPVLQEFLPGPKVGVLGVYNHGKHVGSVVFDIVRSKGASNFGTSTYRITINDSDIRQSAIAIAEHLQWNGVVDMDFVRDAQGKGYLIDFNGRLGGATALTYFAGVDLPYLWYLIAIDKCDTEAALPRSDVHARWILGDTLSALSSLRHGWCREFLQTILPHWGCNHDDFNMKDPLPFFFQCLCYLCKFVSAKGNVNPVTQGMIR